MANECRFDPNSGGEIDTRSLDERILELAVRQHGVVARWQLVQIGVGHKAIDYRLRNRRLHAIHRGVYAVGHSLLSVDARFMAAALAGGPEAVISHISAADLYGILGYSGRWIHVTAPGGARSRDGLRVHRARLRSDEVTQVRGIPVTTVPRTLFDLAAHTPRRRVQTAIHEAEVAHLWDMLSLHDLIARYPRARGTATLRWILKDRNLGEKTTDEEIEALFIDAVKSLPRQPKLNESLVINGRLYKPDALWEDEKVMVELDGRAVHGTHRNFESDRARDRALAAAGWIVIRITWRQLRDEPEAVAADLAAVLATRGERLAA
jgi:very-short-patch-repair endonuclease